MYVGADAYIRPRDDVVNNCGAIIGVLRSNKRRSKGIVPYIVKFKYAAKQQFNSLYHHYTVYKQICQIAGVIKKISC